MLLEREAQLEVLRERLARVRGAGQGRLVLVGGEAGAGKSSLVRAFCAEPHGVPVHEGACEALLTPRPLGPLLDIAGELGGHVEEVAAGSPAPAELVAALKGALRRPAILVLEDLHWADEATLDVLRMLGRRAAGMPALTIGTFRDDELPRDHPLRVVLGELPTATVDRLAVGPLSPAAVERLAGDVADVSRLHARTAGNAFFVTELLATGDTATPATVRDAVLARAARLEPPARRLLEAVAVNPARPELWLLEAVAPEDLPQVEACIASGMLEAHGSAVGFRHEIARVAVEDSMPPDRRARLHRAVLDALTGRADPARLAHHADGAGSPEAVLLHATAAGDRAARLGAHREAAAQYARALEHAGGLEPAARASLLERRAYECYLTGDIEDSIGAREGALAEHRALGDRLRQGDTHRHLSRLAWFAGDNARAEAEGTRAVELLEPLGAGRELAMAYSNLAQLRMLAFDRAGSTAWGQRAIELAEALGEDEVLVHALTNVGTAELVDGVEAGHDKLERSLRIARAGGYEEHVARAYTNLGSVSVHRRRHGAARETLEAGLEYCSERDLGAWSVYMRGMWARLQLDGGEWNEAAAAATGVLAHPASPAPSRIMPLVVLGLLRARRGDPDVWSPLDEALELARATGELQRLGPVAAARAEARWLAADVDRVLAETDEALALAERHPDEWSTGELAVWRRRAGRDVAPAAVAPPFAAELAGDHLRAGDLWTRLGYPYDAALALAWSEDEAHLRRSLDALQRLGARVTAAIVARRLRERGVRGVTRGPRAATRANPAGLTRRQLEVLALLADGRRNADIAGRLHLSEKTVDHHVSAILRKLGVENRSQAGAAAVRLGLV